MFAFNVAVNILGNENPALYQNTAVIHTFLNFSTLLLLWWNRFTPKQEQIFLLLFVDVVAIVLLMHASGGSDSGLGFLLLVTVAIAGILLNSQIAVLLAAMASLMVISESIYTALQSSVSSRHLFSAGTLGLLLFLTALAFRYLTRKLLESQKESAIQARHAEHLEQLAQQIISRMNTGIIVVNHQNEALLVNQAARRLLSLPVNDNKILLASIPEIEDQLAIWKAYPHSRSPFIKFADDSGEVRINFAQLESQQFSDIIIFVEDNRQISQQAQQLKLASLGRLTASIAHEVRNPLGAISHAAQLLGESSSLDKADARLSEIIRAQSNRVNHIIENVLQLSSRKETEAETLNLAPWLEQFREDYCQAHSGTPLIEINSEMRQAKTKVDPGQLHQILTNLCDNGLRYSFEQTQTMTLTLNIGVDEQLDLPYIEVIDEGPGVHEDQLGKIFEPFYTSDPSGSGLGLYICQELCQSNEAQLRFKRTEDGRSCFRLTLAHEQRVFR
jgi:two-component system sensor histidine kinase PilS (NtrC family)